MSAISWLIDSSAAHVDPLLRLFAFLDQPPQLADDGVVCLQRQNQARVRLSVSERNGLNLIDQVPLRGVDRVREYVIAEQLLRRLRALDLGLGR